jgi:YD repeat-containing protein
LVAVDGGKGGWQRYGHCQQVDSHRTTYTYDAANQLQTAVSSAGTTTFTFDQAGNQRIESAPTGVTTNIWNYENQLAGVVLPSGQRVTMLYNADFRRVYNGE